MSLKSEKDFIPSNVRVFYAIAEASFNEMKADEKKRIKPKLNGELGDIRMIDPDQKGFKAALVTIVFCGVCLDALLHRLIVERLGRDKWKEIDSGNPKEKTYEKKLQLLGCQDQELIKDCKRFRDCRNEIVHEKAYFDNGDLKIAQKEAEKAIQFLDSICQFWKIKFT